MVNTVIFDIGNVLAKFSWEEIYKNIFTEDELETAVKLTVGDQASWNTIDQGLISFDEYIDNVGDKAPEIKEKIRFAIIKTFEKIAPFEHSEEWVKDLKQRGYKIYILSNYGDLPFQLSKERYTFLNYTDGQIISYAVKMIKPNRDIFECLFEKFGVEPTQAVFIDDNEQNIIAAKELGLKTVWFKDIHPAKIELEEILSMKD